MNPQPSDPKSDALSVELRDRCVIDLANTPIIGPIGKMLPLLFIDGA